MPVPLGHDRAFSLIELLVTVSLIALLIGLMLPVLGQAKRQGQRAGCLANLRSIEQAHHAYAIDHGGQMLGTSHGASWIEALRSYSEALVMRSPVDTSPHFPGGDTVGGTYRQTSYALNYWLSPDNPAGTKRIDRIAAPSAVVHITLLTFTGSNAANDHVHPHLWQSAIPGNTPAVAASEVQIHAYTGRPADARSLSGYGFLDGHAEARAFDTVFTDDQTNQFDPAVAR
ncbi:MAG: prepilin-type N-terminal cleavage/methylation domain-containing protein [Planctomycetota bacterium]